eukprot:TRINITY_DN10342_c0_g2_i1.p1 TRINITY_DN10342_c0_g2~~TRINITY_DN10342_c0_g2_i1.p1  ORF type:complete len:652 (+),score=332.24 TRINITY_DN10342_c0_g2_i1:76-2031(+)
MGEPKEEEKKEVTLHGTSDYSPEVKKMLKGWQGGPVYGPGYNKVLETEWDPLPQAQKVKGLEEGEEGLKEITWKQLREDYGFAKPATGCVLVGDVSQRDKNNWQYQKHVKLRDRDGTEQAVFFYVDEPGRWSYDEMHVGSLMVVRNPAMHRFMDGQDGMRLEDERLVAQVIHRPLNDTKRMDYASGMRENGNRKFKEEKFEDAVEYYETALNHVTGSGFHDAPAALRAEAREMELKCHNNIAAAAAKLKNYVGAIEHSNKALAINPKSAKAHFRLGTSHAARGNDKEAQKAFNKALEHAAADPSVSVGQIKTELAKVMGDYNAQKNSMKGMYSGFLGGKSQFGPKKGMSALSGGSLTEITSACNFRDLTLFKKVKGKRLHKALLYRSSTLCNASDEDIKVLVKEYGIKTVLDLRSAEERAANPNDKKLSDFTRVSAKEDPYTLDVVETVEGEKAVADVFKEDRVVVEVDMVTEMCWEKLSQQQKAVYYLFIYLCQQASGKAYVTQNSLGMMEGPGELYREVLDTQYPYILYLMRKLADPGNYPVVISCDLGKDMTALLSLLVLGCLGADDTALVDDFMQSQADIWDSQRKASAAALTKAGVDASFAYVEYDTVATLLDFLDGRYCGVAGYLAHIGFKGEEQAALRKAFTKE